MAHPETEGDPIAAAGALIAQGRADEAVRDLRARLREGRGGLLSRLTLVRALLACNDVATALEDARDLALAYPDVAPVLLAFGEALLAAELLPAAIAELQQALRIDPELSQARLLLAEAWLRAGEADKALESLEGIEAGAAVEALAARARAIKAAPRSDAGYVRHLFDQFSADYDRRMTVHLAYAGPQILRDLAAMVMPGREALAILDLGCGTGLAGEAFRPLAARLDGVDLSPAMIARAREKKIYDDLMVADLETALAAPGPAYDLIVAADTLVYLGDLAAVLAGARARLAPDGFFLFTTEAKEGEGFALGPKRRWRHSEAYLRALAEQSGLSVAGLVAATPRHEANQPVAGFAVALMR